MIAPTVRLAYPALGAAVAVLELSLLQASPSVGAWALENVALLLAIVAGIAAYGGLKQRVSDHARQMTALAAALEKQVAALERLGERKQEREEAAHAAQMMQRELDNIGQSIRDLTSLVHRVLQGKGDA